MNDQHVRYNRGDRRDRGDRGDYGSWQNRLRSRNSSSSDPAEAALTSSNKTDAGRDVNANLSEVTYFNDDNDDVNHDDDDVGDVLGVLPILRLLHPESAGGGHEQSRAAGRGRHSCWTVLGEYLLLE